MNSAKVFLFDQEYGLSQEQVCVCWGRRGMDGRGERGGEGGGNKAGREEGRRREVGRVRRQGGRRCDIGERGRAEV